MQYLTIQSSLSEYGSATTPYMPKDFYAGDFIYYLSKVFDNNTISTTNLLLKENNNTLPNKSQPTQYKLSP